MTVYSVIAGDVAFRIALSISWWAAFGVGTMPSVPAQAAGGPRGRPEGGPRAPPLRVSGPLMVATVAVLTVVIGTLVIVGVVIVVIVYWCIVY